MKSLKIKIYKTITLPFVIYGYEACSLALGEECWVRVFENKTPRRIFGPKNDANGEWRWLHNKELHGLYRLANIFKAIKCRRLSWAGNVARMQEDRSAINILKGTLKGKRLLGRPRRRWEENIRMDLKYIGINTRNLVDSTQDRDYWRALLIVALNLWVP